MIKGAPVISEATAIPEASVTTEVQKYPAEVLRCSCSCFCGDQVQKLLLRSCFVGTLVCTEYQDCVPYPYDIWWSLGLFMSCWSTIRIKVCKMSLFRLFESLHFDQISGIFTSPLSFLRDPLWLLTNRHNTPQTSQTNVGNTKQRKKPARLWFGFLPGNL